MPEPTILRYQWTSGWLVGGILVGIACEIWLSYERNLNIGLLLLWSMAYLVIGGLLGFIFSVPKINTDISTTSCFQNRIQENTNLTQISDWLTKILIGAGLVQLHQIPSFIHHVAKVMGRGIQMTYYVPKDNSATMICAAIILFFLTWGFICGYLVMKLVLTHQFLSTYEFTVEDKKNVE